MDTSKFVGLHQLLKNTKLRLKSEYGWDDDFVNEYGRFLILHQLQPNGIIVPGKVVDEVWHDHILHTREYIKFCQTTFGDYHHHDPKDQSNSNMNYLKPTVKLYEETFGHPPPSKFWIEELFVKHNHKPTTPVTNTTTTKSYTGSHCQCT